MLDSIIIGAGPAGLTAAIYALRYGLKVIVFDKGFYGGQVANTTEVANYPALPNISGMEFSTNIYQQAIDLGADIRFESIDSVSFNNKIKSVTTNNGTYEAKTVIIANGAKRRLLECEGEKEFTGKGVSYCATCDGAFFKNKDVAIVGGGNTALEDCLFLSNICNKVYLIHRRDKFSGDKLLVNSIKSKSNIQILYNCAVQKINGDKTVSSIKVKHLQDNSVQVLDLSGIFIAIGYVPDNFIFKGIEVDKVGYIISDENCKTNIEGIYVAGDSRTKILRQIITAAADGAVAAFQASNYINGQ